MARRSKADRELAELERRLREDTPFYAEACLRIVNEEGERVPFAYRPAQHKIDRALEGQRARGLPMRGLVLKARRVGSSSSGMAKLTQRVTLKENRRALIVAQDTGTAGELFGMVEEFHALLPGPHSDPPAPAWLKPPIAYRRNTEDRKLLHFGNKAEELRRAGDLGINSSLRIDTAKEVDAGRGKTITDLWLTEVAFWPDPGKFLSLMNAVYDRPDTLIMIESTANGFNAFKGRVDRAMRGEGRFAFVFIGWQDDENCRHAFDDPDHLRRFAGSVGKGEWGEDEPRLLRLLGGPAEPAEVDVNDPVHQQALMGLYWRRNTIVDKCDGDLAKFRQEYPSTPQEAFIASGRQVFSIYLTQPVVEATERLDRLAETGTLIESAVKVRRLMHGEIEAPTGALWVPKAATGFEQQVGLVRVWEHPWSGDPAADAARLRDQHDQGVIPAERLEYGLERIAERAVHGARKSGQYVIGADVADGLEHGDYHAAQVVDHLTGEQVAEYRSKIDHDELARLLMLLGLYFNEAWIAVEVTGSHGLPVAKALYHKLGYRKVYKRRRQESTRQRTEDRMGWDTNRKTKPLMIATMRELLREGTHGIRSHQLALELTTYVEHDDGQLGADTEANDDLLMAYGIAETVRQEVPARRAEEGVAVTTTSGVAHKAPARRRW